MKMLGYEAALRLFYRSIGTHQPMCLSRWLAVRGLCFVDQC